MADLSLSDFYDQHYRTIYRYFFRKVQCREQAEDLTSLTFLKVQRRYPPRETDSLARLSWLYTIARNTYSDEMKKKENRINKIDIANIENQGSNSTSIDDRIDLNQAFDILSEDDREIIDLYIAGFKHKEIASILNKTTNAVQKSLKRILKKLAQYMEDINE